MSTTAYRCVECEETIPEGEEIMTRLYGCSDCGNSYTRENSANDSSQCPDCSKFGTRTDTKAGKKGKEAGDVPVCPRCETTELEQVEVLSCLFCDEAIDEEDVKDHLANHHIDEVLDEYIHDHPADWKA